MDELKIYKAETVLLKGKKLKETICVALPDDTGKLTDDKICLNKVVRNNLKIRLGDIVLFINTQQFLLVIVYIFYFLKTLLKGFLVTLLKLI